MKKVSGRKRTTRAGEPQSAGRDTQTDLVAGENQSETDQIAELQRTQEELKTRAEELAAINRVATLLNSSYDLDAILNDAIDSVMQILNIDTGVLYLLDPDRPGFLWPYRHRGMTTRQVHQTGKLPVGTSSTIEAIRNRQVLLVEQVKTPEKFTPFWKSYISSYIIIPLTSNRRPLGSMTLLIRKTITPHIISNDVLLNIGDMIGIAIERAEMFKMRDKELEMRRRLEERLRQSELLHRKIIETFPEAVALLDARGKFIMGNKAHAHLFGYESREEFVAANVGTGDLATPEFERFLEEHHPIFRTGESFNGVRGHMQRRDGTQFMAELACSAIRNDKGEIQWVIGLVRDVTELHNYEQALRMSEERYRTLAEAANDAIFIIDRDDRIVYANQFAARNLNLETADLIGHLRSKVFVGENNKIQRQHFMKVYKTGKPVYDENQLFIRGHSLWFGTWLAPILDDKGKVAQILGVSRDITASKETAQRLADSEERFRDIVERSVDGYYFFDNKGALTKWNQAFASIMQIPPEADDPMLLFHKANENIRKKLERGFLQVMGGRNVPYKEFEINDLNGERRWISLSARRVIKDGRVIGVEGFVRDITEQRKVAEALRVSEARYRSLFDSIRREVYGITLGGRYQETNAAFTEAWGAALGRTVKEVVKDPVAARCFKMLIKQVRATGVTAQSSFSMKRGEEVIHYSATLSPVLTQDDYLIGFVGMNLDVTDQVTIMERLRTVSMRLVQVQEEERRRIAREIHDSLGQHLTALQLEVTAAAHASNRESPPPKALNNAVKTIEETITMAQDLCYDLRPPLLDDFGLEAALRDYLTEYQDKWGIAIEFKVDKLDHLLSRDEETALFRVAQESLTNVLKHANARHVEVWLRFHKDQVMLKIQDDGKGFDVQRTRKAVRSGHYGLMTMNERIELLGGSLKVESISGSGTTITALLPVQRGEDA
jgi:PAS domain S-box-containing protein